MGWFQGGFGAGQQDRAGCGDGLVCSKPDSLEERSGSTVEDLEQRKLGRSVLGRPHSTTLRRRERTAELMMAIASHEPRRVVDRPSGVGDRKLGSPLVESPTPTRARSSAG